MIFAFAVVALLLGLVPTASAQIQGAPNPFTCVANAGTPPTVRAEGLTELVGDLVLVCTGGTPTPAGQRVPQVNIQIFLNTNITSRLVGTSGATVFNEALLFIDEPNSPVNPNTPLLNCGQTGAPDNDPIQGPGVCAITSVGNPALTYDGTVGGSTFGTGRPNVFQGRQSGSAILGTTSQNSIAFLGVPLDPPGTQTTRILRIANVRANANLLGSATSLTGFSAITMSVSISGPTSVAINQQQQFVAFILPGLIARTDTVRRLTQCDDANWNDSTGAFTTAFADQYRRADNNGITNFVRFREGFANAFKVRNFRQYVTNRPVGASSPFTFGISTDAWDQNVPGAIYNSEDAYNSAGRGIPNPNPNAPLAPFSFASDNAAQASTRVFASGVTGFGNVGLAQHGTRLTASLSNIPNGLSIRVPNRINLFRAGTAVTSGIAVRVVLNDAAGAGGSPTTDTGFGVVGVSAAGTATVVYEVLYADPSTVEDFDIPVIVAYNADPVADLPTPGLTTQVIAGFAPFYTTAAAGRAASDASGFGTPRFVPSTQNLNIFTVVKCFCNILFPYVTNQQGYDTGIVIVNTSRDPFGTPIQTGRVTLFYYGSGPGGAAAPGSQTSTAISGGQYVAFTLSGGGTNGIDNRAAGFEGYIIAQNEFQYCHAVAYISALGASATTPGANQMYVALILDLPGLNRTGVIGESLGH
ncbi:MAG: hypothetical protein K2X35_14300 [Bryobacteraceae bacterium]|nr:hypothetical protein [Bryobacteraceae bacterium]